MHEHWACWPLCSPAVAALGVSRRCAWRAIGHREGCSSRMRAMVSYVVAARHAADFPTPIGGRISVL